MELTVSGRQPGKKSEIKKIRREGHIPAILYSKGEKGREIVVDGNAFLKVLNQIEKGTLSSVVFTLNLDGNSVKAIIKDIQYAVTSYDIVHLDFEQLHDDVPVTLNIPLKFLNAVECAGVKLGGVLRQVIRQVKVRCLPKDIPDRFNLDVRDLTMGQSLKLNKLQIPSGVTPVTGLNEVAVVVAKK
ncbi:MAG: 50S ribosomal protein L25/general stress protein Ctc [Chlamydiales bacterium]|nr:50S ribosomal protein L25/general stress protein Ctc [Chlamydiales bacterium]